MKKLVLACCFVVGTILIGFGLSLIFSPSAEAAGCSAGLNCETFCITNDWCGLTADCAEPTCLGGSNFCCYTAVGACEVSPFHRTHKACCNYCPTDKATCAAGIN